VEWLVLEVDQNAPTVIVTDNCDGTSLLTATNFTGTLLWSTGETTPSITVTTAGTYTVTQTVGTCTSIAGSGVANPGNPPNAPTVTVTDNCNGTSLLTASNFTGGLIMEHRRNDSIDHGYYSRNIYCHPVCWSRMYISSREAELQILEVGQQHRQ
jgi:hypothetical protein